jgi:hypothetical protein
MKKIELSYEYGEHPGDCGLAQVVAWKPGEFPQLRWGEDTGRGAFSLKVSLGDVVRYGKRRFCGKDKRSHYEIVRKRDVFPLPVTIEQAQMYFCAEPDVAAAFLAKWQYDADNHFFIVEERCGSIDGLEVYGQQYAGAYEPREAPSAEVAYQGCLDAWDNVIVPNSCVEHGLQYRYQIWQDWGSGGIERSEYRYSNEPIWVGKKFKSGRIYRPSLCL